MSKSDDVPSTDPEMRTAVYFFIGGIVCFLAAGVLGAVFSIYWPAILLIPAGALCLEMAVGD